MKFSTLYINEIFVKRECQNSVSEVENITNDDAEHPCGNKCNFLCFYNSCYMSLQIIVDDTLSNQCQKILVYPYDKTGEVEDDKSTF